jgi:hypothetical protein
MPRPHISLSTVLTLIAAATLTIAQTGPQADRLPECIVRRTTHTPRNQPPSCYETATNEAIGTENLPPRRNSLRRLRQRRPTMRLHPAGRRHFEYYGLR